MAGGQWTDVRAFLFERNGKRVVAYWHTHDRARLVFAKPLDGATSWTFNAPTSGTYDIVFWGTITGGTWKSGTVKHTVKKKPLQTARQAPQIMPPNP